jgi:hypothetical protein
MTIMGILTAFAGGVPSLILDRTAGNDSASPLAALWVVERPLILFGSLGLFLAALFFYRQRSLLAYYYGQIALSVTTAAYGDHSTAEWIAEADLWTSWDHYTRAFCCTGVGFIYYALAFILGTGEEVLPTPFVALWAPPAVVLLGYLIHRAVFDRYRDEYDPWSVLLTGVSDRGKRFRSNLRRGSEPPN